MIKVGEVLKGLPEDVIAKTYVQSWDQHIGNDGMTAIIDALDSAGYKIVRKSDVEQMLDRVKAIR